MGTEFEDENAKEKLKAMLNRQFGIGDVGFENLDLCFHSVFGRGVYWCIHGYTCDVFGPCAARARRRGALPTALGLEG